MHFVCVENFPSVVEIKLFDNPTLEKISNCPSLHEIYIIRCPAVKTLEDLPSLRSMEWEDLDAEALPEFLREVKLNKLGVGCSLSLLKLISLQDASSEWGKIQQVQQLKALGLESEEDGEGGQSQEDDSGDNQSEGKEVVGHIFHTKEPNSFDFETCSMVESTGAHDYLLFVLFFVNSKYYALLKLF